jgi:hypothetical protein
MKLIHFLRGDSDGRLWPKRGLVIDWYGGTLYAVHLIIGIVGRKPRLFPFDYAQFVAYSRPCWWLRWSWDRCCGFSLNRGTSPWDTVDLQRCTRRTHVLYVREP